MSTDKIRGDVISTGIGFRRRNSGISSLSELQELENVQPVDYDKLIFSNIYDRWIAKSQEYRAPAELYKPRALWFDFTKMHSQPDEGEDYISQSADRHQEFEVTAPSAALRPVLKYSHGITQEYVSGGQSNLYMTGAYPQTSLATSDDVIPENGTPQVLKFDDVQWYDAYVGAPAYGGGEIAIEDPFMFGVYTSAPLAKSARVVALYVNGVEVEDFEQNQYGSRVSIYVPAPDGWSSDDDPWSIEVHYYDLNQPEYDIVKTAPQGVHTVMMMCSPGNQRSSGFNPLYSVGTPSRYIAFGFDDKRPAMYNYNKGSSDYAVAANPIESYSHVFLAFTFNNSGPHGYIHAASIDDIMLDKIEQIHHAPGFSHMYSSQNGEIGIFRTPDGKINSGEQNTRITHIGHITGTPSKDEMLSVARLFNNIRERSYDL